jgi:hypothetical protein
MNMSLSQFIQKLFVPKIRMKANPYIYCMGGGWGHHIEWYAPKQFQDQKTIHTYTVWGHLPNIPSQGDVLIAKMASGKMAKFVFKSVDRQSDPPDMFFGEVGFVGYEGDI